MRGERRPAHRSSMFYLAILLVGGWVGVLGCDYRQYIAPGKAFRLKSPGYPGKYKAGTTCRWTALTDPDSRIILDCGVFDMPSAGSTCIDYMVLSRTQLPGGGRNFCGTGGIKYISPGSSLIVLLVSSVWSWGGRFSCTVGSYPVAGSSTSPKPPGECDCGWSSKTRIVGGVETGVNEFPLMVGVVSSRLGRLACGGALIGARHALTAAHCLRDLTPSEVALLLADHDTSTGKETNATRMEPVVELLLHPQFDPAKIQNDLAIVKTAKRVDFNQRLGPVCLPFTHPETFVGQKVTALGWGTTEFGGETPDKLRKVKLDVVPVEECVRVYGQNKITRDKQICTYSNGKDACQFDSGGPVVWLDSRSGRWMLAGIISYGRGCAENGIPSVNVRTYSYLDWIVANTADEKYCLK